MLDRTTQPMLIHLLAELKLKDSIDPYLIFFGYAKTIMEMGSVESGFLRILAYCKYMRETQPMWQTLERAWNLELWDVEENEAVEEDEEDEEDEEKVIQINKARQEEQDMFQNRIKSLSDAQKRAGNANMPVARVMRTSTYAIDYPLSTPHAGCQPTPTASIVQGSVDGTRYVRTGGWMFR
jgi:hypothetical protein